MNDRLLFRIPIFYNNKFLGFEYHNIETGQVLTDIKDKTDCENWKFGNWEQCTGLKDENGNLIYEGDIIKCEIDIERELSVVWDDGCFGVYVPTHDDFVKFYTLGNFTKHEWEVKNIEIIGNIHEQKDGE